MSASQRPTLRIGILLTLFFGCCALGTPAVAQVPRNLSLPAKVSLAIYVPEQMRRYHGIQATFAAGQTLEDTILSAAQGFFSDTHFAQPGSDAPFGLLLALHPEFKNEAGHIIFTMNYAVFAAGDQPLTTGSKSVPIGAYNPALGDPLDIATFAVTRQVLAAVVTDLRPGEAQYPAALSLKSRSLDFAARADKPWGSGTGFYFNANGQLLTAAHVVENCIRITVKHGDQTLPAHVIAHSNVLDLAVLDTGAASPNFLSIRATANVELGEPIVAVGYPLQNLLDASPVLTRGNISSQGGLTGSVGQLQFSAPVQPGSSGGPIVSESGEVLGITVGTLTVAALVRQGVIPQNVNFALEGRYAASFLKRSNLTFSSASPVAATPVDDRAGNQAALAAITDVLCYE